MNIGRIIACVVLALFITAAAITAVVSGLPAANSWAAPRGQSTPTLAALAATYTPSLGSSSQIRRLLQAKRMLARLAPIETPLPLAPTQPPSATPLPPSPTTTPTQTASPTPLPPTATPAAIPVADKVPVVKEARPLSTGCTLFGVNMSAGEWGPVVPGQDAVYGTDYVYPSPAELDYYRSKGLLLIRLPILWERFQKTLFAPLDAIELARLDAVMEEARQRGMWIWPETHDNARYYGQVVGSASVPDAAFADFWGKMAQHFKASNTLYAYDLTDEPHDMDGMWPGAAQAAIDAIRKYDAAHTIIVSGDAWSSAESWPLANDNLKYLRDPSHNLVFDAHVFFDSNSTGRYEESYDEAGAYPTIGIDRVKPFLQWLVANHQRGIIGGFGVPGDDPRWLDALDKFLGYLDAAHLGGAYWAGGPWWGSDYKLSVEPLDGQDRPQMAVFARHPGSCLSH